MTWILWDEYVRNQMKWAERLEKLADESEGELSREYRIYSERAMVNASLALSEMIAISAAMMNRQADTLH